MSPRSGSSNGHATRLAQALTARGLLDKLWAQAFTQVPRHMFLPAFHNRTGELWELTTPETVGEQRWLQLAYHDVTWVQRLTGPDSAPGTPACSCIQPSLAAQMLTALAVNPGDRVLEIGAGTGWLTALLSHRCGADNVTAMELDPELIHQAKTTLNQLGHKPTLICADGFNGFPNHAPYDAILSTAAVPHIPQPWLRQTRSGSRIVTPLHGAIAVINVHNNNQATGSFLPEPVHILPLRSPHNHIVDDSTTMFPTSSSSTIPALRDQRFRFILQLEHPNLTINDHGLMGDLLVADRHGSSIQISPLGQAHTTGKQDIWTAISHAHEQWERSDRPGPADLLIELDEAGQWIRTSESTPKLRWRIQ